MTRTANRGWRVWSTLALVLAPIAIYGPEVGRGFVSDDFAWIEHAQLQTPSDVWRVFTTSTGFYRPAVTLSFATNRMLAGLDPWLYGVTNLGLLIGCGLMVRTLASALGATATSATLVALAFVGNFHGISMAVLWVSGRTALLLSLPALLSAYAWVRGHWWQAGAWGLLAMLSKEEAVTLPLLLLAWSAWFERQRSQPRLLHAIGPVLPIFFALVVYAAVRASSGAFVPADAPEFYQFTFAPAAVARNLLEYVDRSATTMLLVLGVVAGMARQWPGMARLDWRRLAFGASWWVAGFALTLWLPVRSSLYAVYPSVGAAIVLSALLDTVLERTRVNPRKVLAVAVVILLLLVPVYRARNQRWTDLAELTTEVMTTLQRDRPALPANTRLVLRDDLSTRSNLASAFGSLAPQAARLFLGGQSLRIEPAPFGQPDDSQAPGPEAIYELRRRALRRVSP